ncbi:MAG: PKD domain-containing protein [Solirubrobacterales bacterium]|nr:PKD domain-containing protein [Solirubrobacterales bacterium]
MFLICAPSAQAGWSQPFDVSPSVKEAPEATGGGETAALPDGGFIYVWNRANQDGSVDAVFRISSPDGTIGPTTELAAGYQTNSTSGNPNDPTVATGADGSIRVAWLYQTMICSPSCDYRTKAQTALIATDGEVLAIQDLDATPPNSGSGIGSVSISISDEGRALLAWRYSDWNADSYRVRITSAGAGELVAPSTTVLENSLSSMNDPEVAIAPGGSAFITVPYGNPEARLDGLTISDVGEVSAPQTLDPGPISLYETAAMIDENGVGTAVYKRGNGTAEQVMTRRMDADGDPLGAGPVMVSDDSDDRWSNFNSGGAAIDPDGRIVVTWSQELAGQGGYGVRSRTIAADGSLGSIQTVSQSPDDYIYDSTVALSPDGGGSVLYLTEPSSGANQVRVRALDTGYVPAGDPKTLASAQTDSTIFPSNIAYSSNGDATALWTDLLEDQWDWAGLRASIFETTPPTLDLWTQPKSAAGQGIVVAANVADRSGPVTVDWDFGDGGNAHSLVAQHTYQAPGTYTIKATATDGAGNVTTKSAQIEVIGAEDPPDPIPPDTRITGKPGKKVKTKSATFKFVSSLTGSKFECRLDRAGWSDCRSPKKLKKLRPGRHTFKVRATKGDLFDRTPAAYTWTVKKAKPIKKGRK